MKVRVHKQKKLVALYFRGLDCWEFFKILRSGRSSDHQRTIIAFTPVFSKAVTIVRAEGEKIPASGWMKFNMNTKGITKYKDGVARAWKLANEENREDTDIPKSE